MKNLDSVTMTYFLGILGFIKTSDVDEKTSYGDEKTSYGDEKTSYGDEKTSYGDEKTVEEGSDFEVPTAEVVRQTLEAKGLQDDVVVFHKNVNTTADMILAVRGENGIYHPAAIFNITFGESGGDYYDDSPADMWVYLFSKDENYKYAIYCIDFADDVVSEVHHHYGPSPLDDCNKFRVQKSHYGDLDTYSVIHGADFRPDMIEWHPEDVDAEV